jgi:hypothetical protein
VHILAQLSKGDIRKVDAEMLVCHICESAHAFSITGNHFGIGQKWIQEKTLSDT